MADDFKESCRAKEDRKRKKEEKREFSFDSVPAVLSKMVCTLIFHPSSLRLTLCLSYRTKSVFAFSFRRIWNSFAWLEIHSLTLSLRLMHPWHATHRLDSFTP